MKAAGTSRVDQPKNRPKVPHKKLQCCLNCKHCNLAGSTSVVVGDYFLVNDYSKGQTIYSSDFILGYCCLVQHASHKVKARYKNNHCIMMVLNSHLNAKTTEDVLTIPEGTTH